MDCSVLLDAIYQAALEPDRWASVMRRFGQDFSTAFSAVLFVDDKTSGRTRILADADRSESIADYVTNWREPTKPRPVRPSKSPSPDIARAASVLREGEVFTDAMVMDRDALMRSAFYNEHLVKFDFHHALGAKLWDRPTGSCLLSLSRGRRMDEFSAQDIQRMTAIQPHLQRAIAMSQRLAWAHAGGVGGMSMLEQSALAILILDQSGHCVHLNPAADALLARNDGLFLARGTLGTLDPSAGDDLAKTLGVAVCGDEQGRRSAGALSVRRPSGLASFALMAMPVGTRDDWMLPQRPRALVTIVDPETRAVPPPVRLGALYRLTPAEAKLAIGIGKGFELKEVAAEQGLTADSARQYLSRIYAKTETRRQSDLARLLAHIGVVP